MKTRFVINLGVAETGDEIQDGEKIDIKFDEFSLSTTISCVTNDGELKTVFLEFIKEAIRVTVRKD